MDKQHEFTPEQRAELEKVAYHLYNALAELACDDPRLKTAEFVVVLTHGMGMELLTVHVEGLSNRFLFGTAREHFHNGRDEDFTDQAQLLREGLLLLAIHQTRGLPAAVRDRLDVRVFLVSEHNTTFRVIPDWRPGVRVLGPPGIR
jgi:cell division protein ZapA (FtsZ GTPase activity inhibitor)